ncbi:XRE family transcriptional regulator [Streptomyces sp. NBC_00984]|uniref:helix-turn-helix domain-containing protein n=1 Tax=Streptomyces sp. NBC_00984 TaxID=2903700 RepID=UPI0038684B9B|nr:XRE family transcriptional regulator [Streptomyces sp. NBC_00984]
MTEIVIDRVRRVMEVASVSQTAFAEAIGVTPDKLSKSLGGIRRFTSLDLARIAEFGSTTVDWLLTGREPLRPSFAARTSSGAVGGQARDELKGLVERFTAAHEVLSLLGRSPGLPDLPAVRTELPRFVDQGVALADDAAARLAAAGSPPVCDMETAELLPAFEAAFGVDVAKVDLSQGIDGAAWQAEGFRLIMIGRTKVPTRQRFTLAHELGHILAADAQDLVAETHLSPGHQKDMTEIRANVFAANLLMARGEITAAVRDRGLTDEELRSLVVRFKVSPSALAARLSQLGFIDSGASAKLRGISTETCHLLTGQSDRYAAEVAWSQAMRLPFRPAELLYEGYLAGETTLRPLAAYTGWDTDKLRAELEPEREPGPGPALVVETEEGDLVFQP